MELVLDGRPITVSEADQLGEGGEARVFRHGAFALKIFHVASPEKLAKLAMAVAAAAGAVPVNGIGSPAA